MMYEEEMEGYGSAESYSAWSIRYADVTLSGAVPVAVSVEPPWDDHLGLISSDPAVTFPVGVRKVITSLARREDIPDHDPPREKWIDALSSCPGVTARSLVVWEYARSDVGSGLSHRTDLHPDQAIDPGGNVRIIASPTSGLMYFLSVHGSPLGAG